MPSFCSKLRNFLLKLLQIILAFPTVKLDHFRCHVDIQVRKVEALSVFLHQLFRSDTIRRQIYNPKQHQQSLQNKTIQSFTSAFSAQMLPIRIQLEVYISILHFVDYDLVEEPSHSRVVLKLNLLVRIQSQDSETCFIYCVLGCELPQIGHLFQQIFIITRCSFDNRNYVFLIIAVRRLNLLESSVCEVRVNSFKTMRVASKIKGHSMFNHCVIVFTHHIVNSDTSVFNRANKGIVSHRDREQASLGSNGQLSFQSDQGRFVICLFKCDHVGVEGNDIGVRELETKSQAQTDVVDQESRVKQHLVVVRVMLVVAGSNQERDPAYNRRGHRQELDVVRTVVAVEVVGDVASQQHQLEVELAHHLLQGRPDRQVLMFLDVPPICSHKHMNLFLNVQGVHHRHIHEIIETGDVLLATA